MVPPFISLATGAFIFAAAVLNFMPGLEVADRAAGLVLTLIVFARAARYPLALPPELLLFALWVVWATMPGLLGIAAFGEFWVQWKKLAQLVILILVLTNVTRDGRTLTWNLLFLLAAVGLLVLINELWRDRLYFADRNRDESILQNSNLYASALLYGMMVLAYLWTITPGTALIRRSMYAGAAAVLFQQMIRTGSRKMLIGTALFAILWIFFVYRREVVRRPSVLVAIIFFGGLAIAGGSYAMRDTVMADRFSRTAAAIEGESVHSSGAERVDLFREGLRVAALQPIFGVGVGGFPYYSSAEMMAHNEYLDVTIVSGFVGAAVYFGLMVVLWYRNAQLAKAGDAVTRRTCQLFKAILLTFAVLAIGRWFYDDTHFWILIGCFIGYIHAQTQRCRGVT